MSLEAQASAAPAAASGETPQKIEVTVAWLKQKVADGSRQPILHFDEQQQYTFDAVKTTFRMVKHSCSYPAPPHKARTRTRARACRSLSIPHARAGPTACAAQVRVWCSSFGESAESLPATMELSAFINTFELITEERHTLSKAHLTGGETIAFEMVQGDHVSELSGFLLGNGNPKGIGLSKGMLSHGRGAERGKGDGSDRNGPRQQNGSSSASSSAASSGLGPLGALSAGGYARLQSVEEQARLGAMITHELGCDYARAR